MRKSIDVSLSPDALPTADVLPLPETDATKADAELPELRIAHKSAPCLCNSSLHAILHETS